MGFSVDGLQAILPTTMFFIFFDAAVRGLWFRDGDKMRFGIPALQAVLI